MRKGIGIGTGTRVLGTGTGIGTPGLHNKIPAHKIFARVWVAQKSFCS